ncbi:hypothetical protein TNCV_298491 [Trichonephila clavipes]|nr:hypothetical protein TNCV_298491 [Trichonephila clavipes]
MLTHFQYKENFYVNVKSKSFEIFFPIWTAPLPVSCIIWRNDRNAFLRRDLDPDRSSRQSVGDDQRPGQANTATTSDVIDKVDDLVAISEGVCRLCSEAVHRPAKGTDYGTSTATSVSVSGRPHFHEADRHR